MVGTSGLSVVLPPSTAMAADTSISRGTGNGVVLFLEFDLKVGRSMLYPIITTVFKNTDKPCEK